MVSSFSNRRQNAAIDFKVTLAISWGSALSIMLDCLSLNQHHSQKIILHVMTFCFIDSILYPRMDQVLKR